MACNQSPKVCFLIEMFRLIFFSSSDEFWRKNFFFGLLSLKTSFAGWRTRIRTRSRRRNRERIQKQWNKNRRRFALILHSNCFCCYFVALRCCFFSIGLREKKSLVIINHGNENNPNMGSWDFLILGFAWQTDSRCNNNDCCSCFSIFKTWIKNMICAEN